MDNTSKAKRAGWQHLLSSCILRALTDTQILREYCTLTADMVAPRCFC